MDYSTAEKIVKKRTESPAFTGEKVGLLFWINILLHVFGYFFGNNVIFRGATIAFCMINFVLFWFTKGHWSKFKGLILVGTAFLLTSISFYHLTCSFVIHSARSHEIHWIIYIAPLLLSAVCYIIAPFVMPRFAVRQVASSVDVPFDVMKKTIASASVTSALLATSLAVIRSKGGGQIDVDFHLFYSSLALVCIPWAVVLMYYCAYLVRKFDL